MTALGVVGALTNLFIAYLQCTLVVVRNQPVEHCVRLVANADSTHESRTS